MRGNRGGLSLYFLPLRPFAMFGDGLFYFVVKTNLMLDMGKLLLKGGNLRFNVSLMCCYQRDDIVDMAGNIFFIAEEILHFGNGHTGIFEALNGVEAV